MSYASREILPRQCCCTICTSFNYNCHSASTIKTINQQVKTAHAISTDIIRQTIVQQCCTSDLELTAKNSLIHFPLPLP